MKDRPSYEDQLRSAASKAFKTKDFAAYLYYNQAIGTTLALASWERFKGSAAYESWIEKYSPQIEDIKRRFSYR